MRSATLADGFLLHNRDILQRMDDSVVDRDGAMLRRARGLCRMPSRYPPGLTVSAMLSGRRMKNTFCLVRGNQAVLSPHFGDLRRRGVDAQWRSALAMMQQVYAFKPARVVSTHPTYHASQWALEQALPLKPCCIIAAMRRRVWLKMAGRSAVGTLSP